MKLDALQSAFEQRYQQPVSVVVRSPGRVNIIGGHTDYNGGYVLPFTIDQAIYFAATLNNSSVISAYSENFDVEISVATTAHGKGGLHWEDCLRGILFHMRQKGEVPGFDLYISADLPYGAGLSSSSALCCGLTKVIATLMDIELSPMEVAQIAYHVERDFIGIPCGFMDQLIICNGNVDHALLINCKTNSFEKVPLNFGDYSLVLIQSNVKRSLHTSDYSVASRDCSSALYTAQKTFPELEVLSDISMEQLESIKGDIMPSQYDRVRYVLNENKRVIAASTSLASERLGRILSEGHLGLKELFGVTCAEVDFLAKRSFAPPSLLGGRMVGGGFGGCVLTQVKNNEEYEQAHLERLLSDYKEEFGIEANLIPVSPGNGLEVLFQ